jgi:hypothetical protein
MDNICEPPAVRLNRKVGAHPLSGSNRNTKIKESQNVKHNPQVKALPGRFLKIALILGKSIRIFLQSTEIPPIIKAEYNRLKNIDLRKL